MVRRLKQPVHRPPGYYEQNEQRRAKSGSKVTNNWRHGTRYKIALFTDRWKKYEFHSLKNTWFDSCMTGFVSPRTAELTVCKFC